MAGNPQTGAEDGQGFREKTKSWLADSTANPYPKSDPADGTGTRAADEWTGCKSEPGLAGTNREYEPAASTDEFASAADGC